MGKQPESSETPENNFTDWVQKGEIEKKSNMKCPLCHKKLKEVDVEWQSGTCECILVDESWEHADDDSYKTCPLNRMYLDVEEEPAIPENTFMKPLSEKEKKRMKWV